ncbi:putative doxorubicin resistance ABC transporter permease protein DrrC [Streptomyces hundungensis]|uniref:Transport permease protein n=1 Tax=Streptomyces hundungensis TaxID=1077946 RepID=A0A387HRW1_9ACTN|nr:ABC transporter permease [Streptomyces hundungensis]AYG84618.1 putative doxorubicin resistance ABC transporter permease protein DrrC [Streptomyces hundungensis]
MTATTSVRPAFAPTAAGLWAESRIIAGRVLKLFLRSPMMLVATFGFPLLQLFMLLAAFDILVHDTLGQSYVVRLAPLIILITAFSAIGSSSIAFWVDIRSGVFNRLRAMPINALSMLFGRMLGDLVRILAIAALVAAIAQLPGFRFEQGVAAALGFFVLVALFGLMCTSLAVVVALLAPYPPVIMAWVQLPTLALTLMSSGYMPLDAYPGAIRPIVAAQPVSTAVEALVGLSHGGPLLVPVLATVAWTVGVSVLCAVVTVRKFRNFVAG